MTLRGASPFTFTPFRPRFPVDSFAFAFYFIDGMLFQPTGAAIEICGFP